MTHMAEEDITQHETSIDVSELITSEALKRKPKDLRRSLLQVDTGLKIIYLQKELAEATQDLEDKKKEVAERKKLLNERWCQFEMKQARFQAKVEKYLKELEAKKEKKERTKRRALKEEKLFRQKEQEAEELKLQVQELKKICDEKTREVEYYMPAKLFIEDTFKKAPTSYFDSNVSKAVAVMNRYKSQINNRDYLCARIAKNSEQLLESQQKARKMKEKHNHEVTVTYTKIANLTSKLEALEHKNMLMEEKLSNKQDKDHGKNEKLFMLMRTIDNMSAVCADHMPKTKRKSRGVTCHPITSRLQSIENFLIHKTAVVEHTKKLMKKELEAYNGKDVEGIPMVQSARSRHSVASMKSTAEQKRKSMADFQDRD